jgi:tetratricopeptide (TPR) repeat protein
MLFTRFRNRAVFTAERLAKQGKYAEAVAILEAERRRRGPEYLILNNLAVYLPHIGREEEALEVLDELEEQMHEYKRLTGRFLPKGAFDRSDLQMSFIAINRSTVLNKLGRRDTALEYVRSVLVGRPDDCLLTCQYAQLLALMGRGEEARAALERAEEIARRPSPAGVTYRPILDSTRQVVETGGSTPAE